MKREQKLVPGDIDQSISSENIVIPDPKSAAKVSKLCTLISQLQTIVDQYEKRITKKEQKLVPGEIDQLISTENNVSSEPLGAAFQKFTQVFRSYSRSM